MNPQDRDHLLAAAAAGDAAGARLLLARPGPRPACASNGQCLAQAILSKNLETVELFAGIIGPGGADGSFAGAAAAVAGAGPEILEFLARHEKSRAVLNRYCTLTTRGGPAAKDPAVVARVVDAAGPTPGVLRWALLGVAEYGHLELGRALMRRFPGDVDAARCAYMCAAFGNLEGMDMFAQAQGALTPDQLEHTCAILVSHNRIAALRALIARGGVPRLGTMIVENASSAEMVELLTQRADLPSDISDASYLVLRALRKNNVGLAKYYEKRHRGDINRVRVADLLSESAAGGRAAAVSYIISRARPPLPEGQCVSLCYIAAARGHIKVLNAILQYIQCIRKCELQDLFPTDWGFGYDILAVAAANGRIEVIRHFEPNWKDAPNHSERYAKYLSPKKGSAQASARASASIVTGASASADVDASASAGAGAGADADASERANVDADADASERANVDEDAGSRASVDVDADAGSRARVDADASERANVDADAGERASADGDASERAGAGADASERASADVDASSRTSADADASSRASADADASERAGADAGADADASARMSAHAGAGARTRAKKKT